MSILFKFYKNKTKYLFLCYNDIVGDNMENELLKDLTDDNEKELFEDVPGEQELDMLTAVDFNLEDTMEVPEVKGEENE